MANNVKIENARGLYAHLLEPHAFNKGDRLKYSLRVLIPEGEESLQDLEREIEAAKAEFKAKFGKEFPKRGDVSLRDADYYDNDGAYEGFRVMSCSSSEKFAPVVVDEAVQPVTDASIFYNGVGVSVVVRPYAYNTMGSSGIAFALQGVQVTDRSADEIGGGYTSVKTLFSNVAKDLGDLI